MLSPVSPLLLTGLTRDHLASWGTGAMLLHQQVLKPFADLQTRAAIRGISLQPASGFRSFERQLEIWNAKALGQRPVLDSLGRPLDFSLLSDREKVFAILRWSALPGASRHHWGTDIDVWDPGAVVSGYRLQLIGDEYEAGGPFFGLNCWLEEILAGVDSSVGQDFFRPYYSNGPATVGKPDIDNGNGVAPEPWHLSYRPLAAGYERAMTPGLLAEALREVEMALKAVVLANLEEIFHRFVLTSR